MSDQAHLAATKRTEFGKGAARRVRRANMIPAVLYGHGTPPLHLTLPGHDTMMALKQTNAVLKLDVDAEEHLALVKDVQRDPIKRTIEHVDLVVIRKGEKVQVDISVRLEGDAAPETVVSMDYSELTVETDATSIPESFIVSIEGMQAGTQVLAGEVTLPAGVELVTDPEALVVNVSKAISEEELEAELAEADAEAGIEQDEPESENGGNAESADGESSGQGASSDDA